MPTDGPKSLDPVQGSSVYDNRAACQIYETLVQYKYLARPQEADPYQHLEPLLLEEMPTRSEDRLTYTFKLKKGVHFQDDPCFPGGKGRELIASDVFYSWKRIADLKTGSKSWWLLKEAIRGFDEYREVQNKAKRFDYDAPVEGFEIINDHEFQVVLAAPVEKFLWVLAMFQTSVVPREAVEKYGTKFGRHPVGTGPFTLDEDDWKPKQRMVLHKNPDYHECYYPTEHNPEDVKAGFDKPAGTRLPIVDRVEITMFVETQPMWLQFRKKEVDYTTVPAENFPSAFVKRTRTLRGEFKKEGITAHALPLLDFIFSGFNMEDDLVGGYTPEKKALRQAICSAIDLNEINNTFYNGINIVYDGPIPPRMEGHPEGGRAPASYRGPDLERARRLLAQAGYPEGKNLPPIDYYTNRSTINQEQTELMRRQLAQIGVKLNPHFEDFSVLMSTVDNRKATMFGFAWGSDYPDAENNLALFYSPYASPMSNHFNYSNPEYDALYETVREMEASPERAALYVKMRDMLLEDCPYVGSMARTRFYLVNPRLKNFKPSEDFYNWIKYLDVDDSAE